VRRFCPKQASSSASHLYIFPHRRIILSDWFHVFCSWVVLQTFFVYLSHFVILSLAKHKSRARKIACGAACRRWAFTGHFLCRGDRWCTWAARRELQMGSQRWLSSERVPRLLIDERWPSVERKSYGLHGECHCAAVSAGQEKPLRSVYIISRLGTTACSAQLAALIATFLCSYLKDPPWEWCTLRYWHFSFAWMIFQLRSESSEFVVKVVFLQDYLVDENWIKLNLHFPSGFQNKTTGMLPMFLEDFEVSTHDFADILKSVICREEGTKGNVWIGISVVDLGTRFEVSCNLYWNKFIGISCTFSNSEKFCT